MHCCRLTTSVPITSLCNPSISCSIPEPRAVTLLCPTSTGGDAEPAAQLFDGEFSRFKQLLIGEDRFSCLDFVSASSK